MTTTRQNVTRTQYAVRIKDTLGLVRVLGWYDTEAEAEAKRATHNVVSVTAETRTLDY